MSTTRILHCADLHLDSPFLGLAELDEGAASTLRESTFRSFGRLVDHAIDQRVDLVTVGGDVYDSEDHGLRSAIRFRDELKRLSAAGIPCAVVAGNHDPLDSRRLRGDLPPGCKLFGPEPDRWEIDRPRGERLVVYGQSYARAKTGDDLARRIIDRCEPGSGLQVAVLHCNVGTQGGHANYAPCSLSQLAEAPFEAWLLGHVHERQVLRESSPLVVYPGNSQGRHSRELGPRGGLLLTFGDLGPPKVEPVESSDVLWLAGRTRIDDLQSIEDLVERMDEDLEALAEEHSARAYVVRWQVYGASDLHAELAHGSLESLLGTVRERWRGRPAPAYLERLTDETVPVLDLDELRQQEGFAAMVLRCADDASDVGATRDAVLEEFEALFRSPSVARHLPELRRKLAEDGDWVRTIIGRAAKQATAVLTAREE